MAVGLRGVFGVTLSLKQLTKPAMSFGQLGCQLCGPSIGRDGSVLQPLTVERNRQVILGGDDPFFEDDRELETGGGLCQTVAAQ